MDPTQALLIMKTVEREFRKLESMKERKMSRDVEENPDTEN